MKKNPFPRLIAAKEAAIKTADFRSKERLRRELRVLKVAYEMGRKRRAA